MNISQSDKMRFSFVHTEKHCASASVSGPSWKVIQTTGETSCSVQSGGKQCLLAYQYQEKSSHVCPKEEDKSDHSTTFNPHPCSWWWSPRPCRRRARLDLSGRWRSGRGWWRRAWRGCCLRRSAPGYESWPHRRRWWSTCRCRWCSAWGQREEQSQRERERISSSGQVAMTQSESCRQPTVWETPWPQRLNAAFVLRPKCLTVCKHSGVFIAPETFVSPQTHRPLKHAASKKRSRILKYL